MSERFTYQCSKCIKEGDTIFKMGHEEFGYLQCKCGSTDFTVLIQVLNPVPTPRAERKRGEG